MKKVLCTIISVFVLGATPALADYGLIHIYNEKGELIGNQQFQSDTIKELALGIKSFKNGQFRLGYACKITDIGFDSKEVLHINASCTKILK